jgi:hypothetical protein
VQSIPAMVPSCSCGMSARLQLSRSSANPYRYGSARLTAHYLTMFDQVLFCPGV